jgi:uridine kinase
MLLDIQLDHPLRVGIDGVDTSGKTRLAQELAAALRPSGRPILCASIDRFHQPRAVRYRLGPGSPEGYFNDSFDLTALRRKLLDPFGPAGSRCVVTEQFDVHSDTPLLTQPVQYPPDTILLFDGIFLHRPELLDAWDFTIFLQVSFDTVLSRAVERDRAILGSAEEVTTRYKVRYIPAQQTYLTACRPQEIANIILVNDVIDQPQIKIRPVRPRI